MSDARTNTLGTDVKNGRKNSHQQESNREPEVQG